jgi:1-acyl-sn-glycerol-3-phosphate acyltransferase
LFVALYRVRIEGRDRIPAEGAALVCSNHQSHLDPIVVGLAFNRRLNFVARKSLFNNRVFGWLIRFLDAIPLDRDGFSLSGIKETLKRLRRDEMVLIFPEGTRTKDGDLGTIKPGIAALARRGGVCILPVGFDGCYAAWPRRHVLPWPIGVINIVVGEPIPASLIANLDDEQLLIELERRLRANFWKAKEARRRRLGQSAEQV